MQNVKLKIDDAIAVIRLDNGVTNAISPALVQDIAKALKIVKKEANGLVLAGGEKFFSIGFDLPQLLLLDHPGVFDFFTAFNRVIMDIFTLPIPTICAVAGHATAGGNILALASDYRFMAEGRKLMGLNEVNLGVPVPYLADLILRQLVGDRAATQMMFSGDLIPADQAAAMGLVDDILPLEVLEKMALKKVTAFAQKPISGFSGIKENRVEQIQTLYNKNGSKKNEQFPESWFQPEVQALLKQAAKKF